MTILGFARSVDRWRGPCCCLVLVALVGVLAPAVVRAGCPSTGGCPQVAVTGMEPCDDEMNDLFELAATAGLGSEAPAYPDIGAGNPATSNVPATMPCTLLKSIGWTESTWTQFCAGGCGQSGSTIISFDCGYGVTQVTSGMSTGSMGSLSFEPARVAAEADYNIGTGAAILAAKWRGVPYIGDNQPAVVEHWYYATWAYNGFSYVNNPNNPSYPAARPPYNGPGGLSRGNYPYQEIVWGFMRNPPSDLWEPLEASYPDSSAVGSDAGDISSPVPEHTDPCGQAIVVVDDQDAEFVFIQGAEDVEQALSGGWDDLFFFQSPYALDVPYTIGRWRPEIPETGLYSLHHWLPASSDAASTEAVFDIAFQGGHFIAPVDQSAAGGDWAELAPGLNFKFVEGAFGHVVLSNLTQEGPEDTLAWDAVRWSWVGDVGSSGESQACSMSSDCAGSMVCIAGLCAEGCQTAGCDLGLCEAATGVCVVPSGDDDDDASGDDDDEFTDSDQDGIPDSEEGPSDNDGDGVPNWWDLDSDDDGLLDAIEGSGDSDGDGIPDYLDEDSDNDGIPDAEEGDHDTDGDGLANYVDEDSDGDGISDAEEGNGDSDGDGTPDYLDEDSNEDGIPDGEDGEGVDDEGGGEEAPSSGPDVDGGFSCSCDHGIAARVAVGHWRVLFALLLSGCLFRCRSRGPAPQGRLTG